MAGDGRLSFVQVEGKRRSAVACQRCKARKVRCSVTATGHPCANCRHDGTECEVQPRKKHVQRATRGKHRALVPNSRSPVQIGYTSPGSPDAVTRLDPNHRSNDALSSMPISANLQSLNDMGSRHSVLSSDTPDEGRHPASFAEAVQANSAFHNERQFYSGDRQGLVHSVMEICSGQRPTVGSALWHQMRAPEPKKVWEHHDWVYLQSKGVFDLPSTEICDSLIRGYFEHVHPLLPVLDAGHFLLQLSLKGVSSMNLLLLWSVLFAAANFAEPETLRAAGYTSRKAMKRAMYTKAKALYDSDYEDDKVCVVQSASLLGFWYSDAEDRNGPWHWLGIATGLCQVMGLHREPHLASENASTKLRQRLLRRIWWSCFMRDRWLSLGLGRPMRINSDDCDVQMPDAQDLTAELEQLPPEVISKYLPGSMNELAAIWVRLIRLSQILGKILRTNYRLLPRDPDSGSIEAHEAELENCRFATDPLPGKSPFLVSLNRLQFEMLLEATVVVLHRPAINFQDPPDGPKSPEASEPLRKAMEAAARMNHIIEKLISLDMVHHLRPMSVTAIVPAMQMHLLECRSTRPLARNLAWSKLGECMMVISELRNTYWGADFTFKLFETAQAILKGSGNQFAGQNDSLDRNPENSNAKEPNSQGEAAVENSNRLQSNAFYFMDGSNVSFDPIYTDPLYDIPDPAIVDPWSLEEFQNMFDMPFGMNAP